MSTIAQCLTDKVKKGLLSKERADEALALIGKLERDYSRSMNQTAAEAAAAARAGEILAEQARIRKRQTQLQVLAAGRVAAQVNAHPKGAYAGVAAVLARDWWNKAGGTSVEARIKTVSRELQRRFGAGIEAFRSRALGFKQNTVGMVDFVRALYGGTVQDEVTAAAARAWGDMTDYAVGRFNAAGGTLRAKKDWRLPQRMDPNKLKGKRDAWISYMTAAYESGRLSVTDFDTGGRMSSADFQDLLSKAYDSISTDGIADLRPGAPGRSGGGSKVANRRLDSRVFEWTNAEAWLDMNRRWGTGDSGLYETLTSHMNGIARDIALLEKLGPNPDWTARWMIDQARKDGATALKAHNLEAIYAHVSGKVSQPVSAALANIFGGVRAWLSSAQLGSAALSAVSDFQTIRQTAKWNAVPASRVLARYTQLIAGEKGSRALAMRTGLIAESWTQASRGSIRDTFDESFTGLSGLVANAVFRVSGLTAHTDAARQAFGLEFLGMLADHAGKSLQQLPPELQRGFAAYGIGADLWNAIRAGVEDANGVRFVSPAKLDATNRAAGAQLMDMIATETDYAVIVPGARERSITLGASKRGTWWGEILRSGMQYKSFPITMMSSHLMRGISAATYRQKFGYLFSSAIGLTLFGAAAMQLKQMAQGKDPRSMADPKFWGAAFIQGGGAGILGDFLYASVDRSQRSFYMQMAGGPTAGLIDDTARLVGGNISAAAVDEDANFGRDFARFVRRYTPGSSLWYARLATDRLLFDQLQAMLDPKAATAWRRMEQRAQKDYGQRFWWRPGQTAPARAPAIGAVVE